MHNEIHGLRRVRMRTVKLKKANDLPSPFAKMLFRFASQIVAKTRACIKLGSVFPCYFSSPCSLLPLRVFTMHQLASQTQDSSLTNLRQKIKNLQIINSQNIPIYSDNGNTDKSLLFSCFAKVFPAETADTSKLSLSDNSWMGCAVFYLLDIQSLKETLLGFRARKDKLPFIFIFLIPSFIFCRRTVTFSIQLSNFRIADSIIMKMKYRTLEWSGS